MASCRVCGRQDEVSDIHWTCPRCGHEQEEAMDAGDSVYDIRVSCRKCQEWIEVML